MGGTLQKANMEPYVDLEAVYDKHFKSVDDVVSNMHFTYFLQATIREFRKERYNRKTPVGYRFTKDWYDRVKHEFDSEYCLSHIRDIWNKNSSLSAEIRNGIQMICNEALRKTLIALSKKVL